MANPSDDLERRAGDGIVDRCSRMACGRPVTIARDDQRRDADRPKSVDRGRSCRLPESNEREVRRENVGIVIVNRAGRAARCRLSLVASAPDSRQSASTTAAHAVRADHRCERAHAFEIRVFVTAEARRGQHETSYQSRMIQRQIDGDRGTEREADDVGGRGLQRGEQLREIVAVRKRCIRTRRPPDATNVVSHDAGGRPRIQLSAGSTADGPAVRRR